MYINDNCVFLSHILESPQDGGGDWPTNHLFCLNKRYNIIIVNSRINTFQFDELKIDIKQKKKLLIKTIFNSKIQFFNIDLRKGRYIGFDKYKDSIRFVQNKIPLQYE